MREAGSFESLFPMQELSVMGLVEVVPYLWRFRVRCGDDWGMRGGRGY
jgi:lipid A disaccharide synthetase